jgi:hypothetical protein
VARREQLISKTFNIKSISVMFKFLTFKGVGGMWLVTLTYSTAHPPSCLWKKKEPKAAVHLCINGPDDEARGHRRRRRERPGGVQARARQGLPACGLRGRRGPRRRVEAHAGLHAAADAGAQLPVLGLPLAAGRVHRGVPAARPGGGVPRRLRAPLRRPGVRPVRQQGAPRRVRRGAGGAGRRVGAVGGQRRGLRRRHRRVAAHRAAPWIGGYPGN